MTAPIDVAYVDIVARTKEFRKDIKDIIDDEVKELEKETTSALDEIDKHFKQTAKDADKAFKDIDDTVKKTAKVIEDELGHSMHQIGFDSDGLRRTVGSNFDKMFLHAAQNGQFVERRVVPIWRQVFRRIGESASDMFNQTRSAFSSVGTFFSSFASTLSSALLPIIITLLPGLLSVLIALGGALAQLVGLLALIPGSIAFVVAAIAPLIIGFQNFGEALGAILAGDKEGLDEALKKLAPAARSVAKEFAKIVEPFRKLQLAVQQALFAPLVGELTRLVKTIIGPLQSGLVLVAGTLGQLIGMFMNMLNSADGVNFINQLFFTTNEILKTLGPAMISLAGAFMAVAVAALPTIKLLADKFAGLLLRFADFLQRSIQDGSLQKFIDNALATLKQILDLSGAIIDFFKALFTPETISAGSIILGLLTDIFNVMTTFIQSEDGQQFLKDLAQLAIVTARLLGGIFLLLAKLTTVVISTIIVVLDFFGIVDRGMTQIGQTSVNTGETIVNAIASVPQRLMALGGTFAAAGQSLIQSFIGGFRNAGNFINDVAGDIVRGIKSGLNRFIATINSGIANLDALLPFSLARIPSLASGGIVGARSGGVLAQVAEGGEDEVVSPLSDLKQIIADVVDGPAVTFGPNSINVTFSGAVPTEAQARSTGQAIGEGIISLLSQRNLRAQVRAV